MTNVNGIRFNQYTPSFAGKNDEDEEDVKKSIKNKVNTDKALAFAEKNSGKLLSGPNIIAGTALLMALGTAGIAGALVYKNRDLPKTVGAVKKELETVQGFVGKEAKEFPEKVKNALINAAPTTEKQV